MRNEAKSEKIKYIYIITVLVVTRSLCGFVPNQVQFSFHFIIILTIVVL